MSGIANIGVNNGIGVISSSRYWTPLLIDDFSGTTIDVNKWTETDVNSIISINNNQVMISLAHSSSIAQFVNNLKSVEKISSGIAVVQGFLNWTTNSAAEAIGGIYLWKDNNNYASITSRRTGGGKLRCRIYTGGVSRYDDANTNSVLRAKDVKIWTDGTTIRFYYYNVNIWTQMGTNQTFSLGYDLYCMISCQDISGATGANPIKIDNMYLSPVEYSSQYPAIKTPETILNNSGSCWFARNKAVYDSIVGKTFIGVVHNNVTNNYYTQYISTLDNLTGETSRDVVGTVHEKDDHDEPSILVRSSDGKLFTCYSEHGKTPTIRYRISTNAHDASIWDAEGTITTGANNDYAVTYPSCFEAANGNIYIFYRESINGFAYYKSTDGGATFGGRTLFFFGDTNRGYVTYAQSPVNADIIHMVASEGHPINITETSIVAFYFDCSTDKFYKLNGTDVTANIPLNGLSDVTVVMNNILPDTGWMEDIVVDSIGNPRYLMTFHPNGQNTNWLTKDLYYAEWNGSSITTPTKIHTSLSRYTTTAYSLNEAAYPLGSYFDRNNVNRFFASKDVNGIGEIFEIIRVNATTFTSIQKTFNSAVDQWRPFTVKTTQRNVFWLNKETYNTYIDFNEQLVCGTF